MKIVAWYTVSTLVRHATLYHEGKSGNRGASGCVPLVMCQEVLASCKRDVWLTIAIVPMTCYLQENPEGLVSRDGKILEKANATQNTSD